MYDTIPASFCAYVILELYISYTFQLLDMDFFSYFFNLIIIIRDVVIYKYIIYIPLMNSRILYKLF